MLISLVLLFSFCVPASAAGQRVFDYADLLSNSEIDDIESWCEAMRDDWDIDLAFLTTDGTDGMEVREYGAQFFLANDLGVGSDQDGVIFVLDMDTREGQIVTHGLAIDIYTDYYIDKMWNNMVSYLSDGDYYGAFYSLYEDMDYYAGEYQKYLNDPDYVSEYQEEYGDDGSISPLRVILALVIGLIGAAIWVGHLKSRMNNVKPFTDGTAYLTENGYHLNRDESNFVRTYTTSAPIPDDDDNDSSWGGGSSTSWGGGSSTFSSGGSNFGGGGGKF